MFKTKKGEPIELKNLSEAIKSFKQKKYKHVCDEGAKKI